MKQGTGGVEGGGAFLHPSVPLPCQFVDVKAGTIPVRHWNGLVHPKWGGLE